MTDYRRLYTWKEALDCASQEDEDLPPGWKKFEDEAEEKTLFLGRVGELFSSRVTLMEHLLAHRSAPNLLLKLWHSLEFEGWMQDEDTPLWRKKFIGEEGREYEYLSPEMKVYSLEEYLEHA